MTSQPAPEHLIDSRYAMWRLVKALVIMVMGSSCMFIVSVVLPEVQAEFGVSRSEASLPSTLLWIGFGAGALSGPRTLRIFVYLLWCTVYF